MLMIFMVNNPGIILILNIRIIKAHKGVYTFKAIELLYQFAFKHDKNYFFRKLRNND